MDHHTSYTPNQWIDFVSFSDEALLRKCRMDIFKATGKGGQKKNKTSNAIRLTLNHLSVTATASRSRQENISKAVKKMRMEIALDLFEVEENRSGVEKLPATLDSYIRKGMLRINEKNPLYAMFTGIMLDIYLGNRGDIRKIAEKIETSSSQIHRFISNHPALLQKINLLKQKFRETNIE